MARLVSPPMEELPSMVRSTDVLDAMEDKYTRTVPDTVVPLTMPLSAPAGEAGKSASSSNSSAASRFVRIHAM